MSTLDPQPIKGTRINTKLLPIAAILLVVLGLLFMATPLLRVSNAAGRAGFNRPANGQFVPGTGTGQNGFSGQDGFTPGQGSTGTGGTGTGRTFNRPAGANLLRLSFLSGITGTIVYGIALLIALAAAVGMFLAKRWGQVLGILMAVIYLLLGLVSFLPILLAGFLRGINFLSMGLSILHVVLAIAVIVLASIPAKKMLAPLGTSTPTTPPSAESA
jgi:hypothetical protein